MVRSEWQKKVDVIFTKLADQSTNLEDLKKKPELFQIYQIVSNRAATKHNLEKIAELGWALANKNKRIGYLIGKLAEEMLNGNPKTGRGRAVEFRYRYGGYGFATMRGKVSLTSEFFSLLRQGFSYEFRLGES